MLLMAPFIDMYKPKLALCHKAHVIHHLSDGRKNVGFYVHSPCPLVCKKKDIPAKRLPLLPSQPPSRPERPSFHQHLLLKLPQPSDESSFHALLLCIRSLGFLGLALCTWPPRSACLESSEHGLLPGGSTVQQCCRRIAAGGRKF